MAAGYSALIINARWNWPQAVCWSTDSTVDLFTNSKVSQLIFQSHGQGLCDSCGRSMSQADKPIHNETKQPFLQTFLQSLYATSGCSIHCSCLHTKCEGTSGWLAPGSVYCTHPLSISAHPMQGHKGLEPILADIGRKAAYALYMSAVHYRADIER